MPNSQRLNAKIIGPSRFAAVEQFGNILLTVIQTGAKARLKDVARVDLGAKNYAISSTCNNAPASGIGLQLDAGAN